MKIVMYYVSSDGCSYSFDVALPFEYESVEKALVDFEEARKAANGRMFEFVGHEFYPIEVDDVEFLTLDEWFDRARIDGSR